MSGLVVWLTFKLKGISAKERLWKSEILYVIIYSLEVIGKQPNLDRMYF